jgi:hypothetical protein
MCLSFERDQRALYLEQVGNLFYRGFLNVMRSTADIED